MMTPIQLLKSVLIPSIALSVKYVIISYLGWWSLILLLLIPVATYTTYHFGFFDHHPLVRTYRMLSGNLEQLANTTQETFDLYNPQSAKISYNRHGKTHHVYVSYHPELITKMSQHHVFLDKDSEMIDITNQPGIPYITSANRLGGSRIIVRNILTYDTVKTYSGDQVPKVEEW